MKTEARNGQWLADIALAKLGTIECVWTLAVRNGLSVTSELVIGQKLQWDPEDIADAAVTDIYSAERIEPATAISEKELMALMIMPDNVPVEDLECEPVEDVNTAARIFNTIFDKQFS